MHSELDAIDHALRGALNAALLNIQLLSACLEHDEQARPLLERVSAELRRVATELLPAALRITSLEVQDLQRVDLGPLVEGLRAEHGLGRTMAAPGESVAVVADPRLVATAITHLLTNALAATPPGAPAPEIAVEPTAGGGAALVVRNACANPPPAFSTDGLPVARRHVGGVALVVRVARLHGGALTYESKDGHVTARLWLPPAPREISLDPAPTPASPGRGEPSPSRGDAGRGQEEK